MAPQERVFVRGALLVPSSAHGDMKRKGTAMDRGAAEVKQFYFCQNSVLQI
jgi:hypothetical protein